MLMKTINHIFKILVFFLIITLGFTGCTKKEYFDVHEHYYDVHEYYEYYEGVKLVVYNITVDVNDWVWNQNFERFEYIVEFDKITEDVYETGFVNAQIFVWEENRDGSVYETLKPLPFVQTYRDQRVSQNYTYTETISYDVSPGYILFSIQLSDLYDSDQWLNTYSFKVSIMQ